MKKFSFILIVALMISVGGLCIGTAGGIAFAAVTEAECDEVFIATINELLTAEDAEETYFAATKNILYDLNLEPFGYLYSFSANSNPGFAIVINSNDIYECVEIYFGSANPYGFVQEDSCCIYVNMMVYWAYADGNYYDVITEEKLPEIIVEAARGKAYFASNTPFVIVPESIYYTYRSDVKYQMVNKHPHNITNDSGCVPTMGANLIQYFDRYCTNLIADYTPGTLIGTIYRYKAPSSATEQVILQLASDMGCGSNGATQLQFVNGMAKYCSDRNYTFTYTSCMSSGQFNYSAAKQQMQVGKPIALFLDPYTIESIVENSGYDSIEHRYFTAPHAMAAFGYRDITYTLTNGQSRSDSYLQVATGNTFIDSGYCKISSSATIDQALAIYIY